MPELSLPPSSPHAVPCLRCVTQRPRALHWRRRSLQPREAPSQTSLHAAPRRLAEVSRSRFQPQLHALACETSDKLLTLSKGQLPLTIKMK